ncbi:MAG: hypothetical protein MUF71_05135 [Candidatus Kapabacteria bacterium]|jgi:hypothetical protein|nr:hypothetical protein [Candidatus Kapabacteria bacterium]
MATAQQPKTTSELRQEMWAAHNRFSDLTSELIHLKESAPGSARHLQVPDEHLLAKREMDRLQAISGEAAIDSHQNPIVKIAILLTLLAVVFSTFYLYWGYKFIDFIYGAALR